MSNNSTTNGSSHRPKEQASVGIGQAIAAADPAWLSTILGSCIAVTLYSPRLRLGMLSHVVLPRSTGTTAYPAKFADTAVPYMISVLQNRGVKVESLVAKVTGGACMFGAVKPMQIGEANVQAAMAALDAAGVRVAAQHVGGTVGRRVFFELATGNITVECIGQPPQTI